MKLVDDLYVDDPCFFPKDAAAYLGIAPRTLRELHLDRVPMATTSLKWGYRRSTLNRYLKNLEARFGAFATAG